MEQLVRDLGIGTGSHGGQGTARGAAGTSGLTLDNAMTVRLLSMLIENYLVLTSNGLSTSIIHDL